MYTEENDIKGRGNNENIFQDAVNLRDQGKFNEALVVLERLFSKNPRNLAILLVMADLNWDLGRLDKAADFFRFAIDVPHNSEPASLGLFHCLWKMGKKVEALDEMKRFMSISYSKDYAEILNEINEKS
jgi:tetratricopeptide (TPR) repeat protein